jgi:ABC-type Fe3+ transport system substrate-binding protein
MKNMLKKTAVCAALAIFSAIAPGAHAADAKSIEAAEREGHLVWYTTLLGEATEPLVAEFAKRHPAIKVEVIRASAPLNAKKIIAEAKAGKPVGDLFDGSSTAGLLMAQSLVQPYISPSAKTIPAKFKDPDGYWTSQVLYYMTVGYNPGMIAPDKAPRQWSDLLAPQWRGKMAWSAEEAPTAGQGLIANVLLSMGEVEGMRYLRQLADQRIASIPTNPRKILALVGDKAYPIGLQVMVHHTVMAQREGMTVNWVNMQPLTATGNAIGIVRHAQHPNAARLMVDFVLSEKGQTLLKGANHIPSNPVVKTGFPELDNINVTFISPVLAAANNDKWNGVMRDLFAAPKVTP